MEMTPTKSEGYLCSICGDKGTVPKAYIEPSCGSIEGKQKVPCPKCSGTHTNECQCAFCKRAKKN